MNDGINFDRLKSPVRGIKSLINIGPKEKHQLKRNLNRLYHSRLLRRQYNTQGVDIFTEDWDNLIILDACRFDALEWHHSEGALSGKLESRTSRGSFTPEWLSANFDGRDLTDTVYVTGMPMPFRLGVLNAEGSMFPEYSFDLEVHDIVNVWKENGKALDPDDDVNIIVDPDDVASAAVDAQENYPNKRLLVHIVQPHDPYVGAIGESLPNFPWEKRMYKGKNIDLKEIRRAYYENVEIAVNSLQDLLPELRGKTVVSSDHGELLWENSFPIPFTDFKHTNKMYIESLVKVPWLINERGKRKDIFPEPPSREYGDNEGGGMTEAAENQLRALGYME